MAFQTTRGGIITALETALFRKGYHGALPKTINMKDTPKKELHLQLGSVSSRLPNFAEKKDYSFASGLATGYNKHNPLKNVGFARNRTVLSYAADLKHKSAGSGRFFSSTTGTNTLSVYKDVDSHQIVIPLSGEQKVLFNINKDTTVKGFLGMLQEEDPSVKNLSISKDGVKIAGSSKISALLNGPFQISFNNRQFTVTPNVQSTIARANHSEDNAIPAESYESIKDELIPLYMQKLALDKKAERHANIVMYGGLGYLVAQWAFLARLTWWEFNWDIMEPVTYFVTFGTAVLGYFYFAITRREYTFQDVRENILRNRTFKSYLRTGFPIERYFELEHKLKQVDPEALEKIQWEVEEGLYEKNAAVEAKVVA